MDLPVKQFGHAWPKVGEARVRMSRAKNARDSYFIGTCKRRQASAQDLGISRFAAEVVRQRRSVATPCRANQRTAASGLRYVQRVRITAGAAQTSAPCGP